MEETSESGADLPDHPLMHFVGWMGWLDAHKGMDPGEFVLRFSRKKVPVQSGGTDMSVAGREHHLHPPGIENVPGTISERMVYLPAKQIAEQIHCYPRAIRKLRDLHQPGVLYEKQALEQASGYATSIWRARRFHKENVADLTMGLGVDTMAWARAGSRVVTCEQNRELAATARHNHRLLGLAPFVSGYHKGAIKLLRELAEQSGPRPDLYYADPSRRRGDQRVFLLDACEPNVFTLLRYIRELRGTWLLKLSPLVDLTYLQRHLYDCSELFVVSVRGEVKEILAYGGEAFQLAGEHKPVKAVIRAVLLDELGHELFDLCSASEAQGKNSQSVANGPIVQGQYILDPDSAIVKAGLIDTLARQYGMASIDPRTRYLVSTRKKRGMPGRWYKIEQVHEYKPRQLVRHLAEQGLTKVRIHESGFPVSAEKLYNVLRCEMGEQADLLAARGATGELLLLVARRL